MSTVNTAQDANTPAFPCPDAGVAHFGDPSAYMGMSLRDYFAGEVLTVCYAETCKEMEKTGWVVDWRMGVALDAYRMADAMLAARTTGARDE